MIVHVIVPVIVPVTAAVHCPATTRAIPGVTAAHWTLRAALFVALFAAAMPATASTRRRSSVITPLTRA
eukprot:6751475-Prymnesium_polylepis.1